jgi:hypothetical protein
VFLWYLPYKMSVLFSVYLCCLLSDLIVYFSPQENDSVVKNFDIWAVDGKGDSKAKKVMCLVNTHYCLYIKAHKFAFAKYAVFLYMAC